MGSSLNSSYEFPGIHNDVINYLNKEQLQKLNSIIDGTSIDEKIAVLSIILLVNKGVDTAVLQASNEWEREALKGSREQWVDDSLKALKQVPHERRAPVCRVAAELLKGGVGSAQGILDHVASMEDSESLSRDRNLVGFLQNFEYCEQKEIALKLVKNFPERERVQVMRTVNSLVESLNLPDRSKQGVSLYLIENWDQMSQDNRQAFTKALSLLTTSDSSEVKDSMDPYSVFAFIKIIDKVPKELRQESYLAVAKLGASIPTGIERAEVFRKLEIIDKRNLSAFCTTVTPLMEGIRDHCGYFFEDLLKIKDLTGLAEAFKPWANKVNKGLNKGTVFRKLEQLSVEERNSVSQAALKLTPPVSIETAVHAMDLLQKIPANRRDVIAESLSTVLEGLSYIPYHVFEQKEKWILLISKHVDSTRLEKMSSIVKDLLDGLEAESRLDLLITALQLPESDAENICQIVAQLLKETHSYGTNLETRTKLLQSFRYTKERSKVAESLIEAIRGSSELPLVSFNEYMYLLSLESWSQLLASKQTLRDALDQDEKIGKEVAKRMENFMADQLPGNASVIASLYCGFHTQQGLTEEAPLFQEAIRVITICDPAVRDQPKNPFRVFHNLVERLKVEPLVEPAEIPRFLVGDRLLSLNLSTLRQRGIKRPYVVSELPDGIDETTIQQLFGDLDQRLQELSPEEKKKTEEEIQAQTGHSYNTLKDFLLVKSSAKLRNKRPKDLELPVNTTQLQYYYLLQNLMSLPNELGEGQLLTEREAALMKLAESIQNCDTGQEDCVNRLYHQYIPFDKKPLMTKGVGDEAACVHLLDSSIQYALEEAFNDEAFIRSFLGPDVQQISHQGLYIRNYCAREFGLRHELTFDSHTGTLDFRLMKMSSEEFVELFMNYYGPDHFIKILIKESSKGFKDLTLFSSLQSFLLDKAQVRVAELKEETEGFSEQYIKWSDQSDTASPVELSYEGALLCLKTLGYITDHSN